MPGKVVTGFPSGIAIGKDAMPSGVATKE